MTNETHPVTAEMLALSPTHDPELVADADRIEAQLSRDGMHGAAQLIPRLLRALRDSQADSRQQARLITQLQSVPEERREIAERLHARREIEREHGQMFGSAVDDLDTLLQDAARYRNIIESSGINLDK